MIQDNSTLSQKIDFTRSGVARYIQLSTLFRRKIETSEWAVGCQIPTVEDLSAEYGVARATIRQAIGLLESEGLVSRYRARGTFVNELAKTPIWCEIETDWNGLLANRDGVTIEILREIETIPLPAMEFPIGEPTSQYRYLRRRHSRDGHAYLVADLYIDEKLIGKIDPAELAENTAMRLVGKIPNFKIADARQLMTVGSADMEVATLLDIELNSPVVYVDRFVVDRRGRLALISKGIYRGDIIKLDFKLK